MKDVLVRFEGIAKGETTHDRYNIKETLEQLVVSKETDIDVFTDILEPIMVKLSNEDKRELRNFVVLSYDNLRNPEADYGRLSYNEMQNMQKVTAVIDFFMYRAGGTV